jgi:hypothetical protein
MDSSKPSAATQRKKAGLLRPREVAAMFRVDPKTVARWARAGKLPYILTPSGQHLFRLADLKPFLEPVVSAMTSKDGTDEEDPEGTP